MTFLRHGADGRHAVGLQRMLDHIADGSFHLPASAAKLTQEGGWKESAAKSAFRTYFSQSVTQIAEPYRAHLMRIADFRGGDASRSE